MSWKNVGWGLLAGMFCTHAVALEPWTPTDSELASLPALCKAKTKSAPGNPDYDMWQNTLGKDFLHTHHYCAGLNFINRYYRARSDKDKGFNLDSAENNLSYMVAHAEPQFSLMPEIYMNRGLVYSLRKQHGKAIADMNKAIELDPRLVKPYSVLADYYASTKQKSKALETVAEGLRYNPNAKSLQRRYNELGGKLPYPAPIRTAPVEAAQPVAAPPRKEAEPTAPEKAPNDASAPATAPAEPATQTRIGSPKNPYCRFCPD